MLIVVQDPAGFVIAGATVELLDKDDKVIRKLQTNKTGEAVWTGLPVGDSIFRLSIEGFKSKTVSVTLLVVGEKRVEVKLDISAEPDGPFLPAR